MELSCQSSIIIIDIKVELQNLVFKYHCSLKINRASWLIPDLGQERYNKHLEHLDILEKMLSETTRVIEQGSGNQSESAPTAKKCENMKIQKDTNCNE